MAADQILEVNFQPVGKRVKVSADTKLIEAARQAGIRLTTSCGGVGSCGQCRVIIMGGDVSRPTGNEKYVLGDTNLQDGHRLACSVQIQGDIKVYVPKTSVLTEQRLQIDGEERLSSVDPAVCSYDIDMTAPQLHDLRADLERVTDCLRDTHDFSDIVAETAVVHQLSNTAREHDWKVSVCLRNSEIVGLAPQAASPLGMAVDLGTTKIAAYLLNLETGKELTNAGALNPQISFGEDLVSRLTHALRNPGSATELTTIVRQTLDDLVAKMISEVGGTREQVVEACIVGNTAMIHLLLNLPVRQLAASPYVAATASALDVKAREIGLTIAPGAYIHVLPGIGGFIGADHVAMILASDLDCCEETVLGVDIGTNTEITIARPDLPYVTAASCASGPAFEGAHISDGMRAAAGAIEAVRLTEDGVELKTIENEAAVGLCGSGIVDAVAELWRHRFINAGGRFDQDNSRIRIGRRGPEFLLSAAQQPGDTRDIVIAQEDINEIQLAKGAIRAGLESLLDSTNTAPEAVNEVIIAGAFGSFLDIKSACDIGLFPDLPNARYRQVGNAAGAGAKWALSSTVVRTRAVRIAETARYIELTTFSKFKRYFARGMLFSNSNPSTGT